jgi:CRISPR-associated protein Cas2
VIVKTRYIVTYDITDDVRRTAIFKALRGHGDHLQYSVFRCDLSDTERTMMVAELFPLLDPREDQILVIDIGPVDGRAATCVTSLGRRYIAPERSVVII